MRSPDAWRIYMQQQEHFLRITKPFTLLYCYLPLKQYAGDECCLFVETIRIILQEQSETAYLRRSESGTPDPD